ncbi:hypothetical protein ABPG72_014105 [Tetrahymena utriculariae]
MNNLQSKYASQPNRQTSLKPPLKDCLLTKNHTPDHIVGVKNSFNEIQKRKFFKKFSEPIDILYLDRKYETNKKQIDPKVENYQAIAHQFEQYPPCSQEERKKGVARADITEEGLDDWIAQNMNRSIPEMLDPKKKFNIPYNYLDKLKERYPHLIPQVEVVCEDEEEMFLRGLLEDSTIVDRKTLEEKKKQFKRKSNKKILESFFLKQQNKEKIIDLNVDPKKLEPKVLPGTQIKVSTIKYTQGNNSQSNEFLQKYDIPTQPSNKNTPYSQQSGYNPRISVTSHQKKRQITNNTLSDEQIEQNDSKNNFRSTSYDSTLNSAAHKLFTLNISNFLRKSNNEKNIETSIAEKELSFIEGLINKQNERKQLEELTREQKKQSADYFKDIQKQNRKELNRIVNDAMSYCQNPPDLGQFQHIPTNTSQQVTKEKRPQSHSSSRAQSSSAQKRFFILTKLQSKPSTAQSGKRTTQINNMSNLNTNQHLDKIDYNAQQTKQSFYLQTHLQTDEQEIPKKTQNNFFDFFQPDNFIKVQNDSPIKSSLNPTIANQDYKIQINKFFENNNSQNSNSSFYYQSLRTYKQNKINQMRQRVTLKELTKDYINQDQNKGTTIFNQSNLNKFQQKQRIKSTSMHNNSSFTNNYTSNLQTSFNGNLNESINFKKNEQIQTKKENPSTSIMQGASPSKKQSDLPEQVEDLLNGGSEDNLLQPNDDFANLVLHLEELAITEKKHESQMSNAEFWFYKSWKLIEKGQTEVATQCLKQVLIQEKLHFESIFNMGSLYEKTKKFKTALKWLKISQQFGENQEQIKYGIALCFYKLKVFDESYNNINSLILQIKEKDEPQSRYIYLRALCLKQMKRIQEAEDDYKIFYKKTSPKNFDLLMHFMILFSFKYKNKITKYQDLEIKYSARTFCNFHSAVQQILQGEYFEMKLTKFYKESLGWINQDELLQKLQNLSFFKRFAVQLLKKSLPYLEHKLLEKEKLINPPDDEIYIIISGCVQVFDHSKNYEKPDIVSYYTEGDIIGCDQLENDLCKKPNVWLISQTPIEYIKMNKNMFFDLWKGQYSLEGEKITSLLRNCPMFKGISEISMLKLSYELVSMEEFKLNDVIYNDGTYLESMNFNYIEMKKCSQRRGAGLLKRIVQKMTSYTNSLYKITKFRKFCIKNKQKIQKLMWKTKIIKGFYIIVEGIVKLENDQSWSYILTPGDFFGENLIFKVKSLSNFGRIRAVTEKVKVLFLPRDKFNQINSLDRAIMKNNCINREQIKNIEYQANRYSEVKKLKKQRQKEKEEKILQDQTDEDYIQSLA